MILPGYVNLDLKPEVTFAAEARVEKDDKGKPFLKPEHVSRWNAALGRMVGKGRVRVEIVRDKGDRSNAQNKALWGVIYEDYFQGWKALAEEIGQPCPFKCKYDVHVFWKARLIGSTLVQFQSEELELPPSTAKLSMEEFSNYVSEIMSDGAQRGFTMRAPGEE